MDLPSIEALEPAEPASLARWREGDAWLAGGTWLFSEPQPHLRRLLDLRAFAWKPLTATPAGLQIAATCTVAQLHAFEPPRRWPAAVLLQRCPELLLASWKVWHEASVGGNLCLALPAGSLTALTAALDGICTVWRPDGSQRELPVTEFVIGPGENALMCGELLRAVTLPAAALRARAVVRQASLSPHGRSAALVIGRRDPGGETVITVTAAVSRPLQLRFTAPPTDVELSSALAAAEPVYQDDVHGDRLWRAHLTALLSEEVRAELQEVS